MPSKPKRICNHPGCSTLVESGQGYCDAHKKDKRQAEQFRSSFRDRGYDTRWDKVRALKVKRNPICEECLKHGDITPVEIVHHIEPVDKRPDLLLDMDNLQSLCRKCHGQVHSSM